MDPSISRRLIHVINNFEGPRTIQSKMCILCYDLSCIKFLINTREKMYIYKYVYVYIYIFAYRYIHMDV